MFSKIISYCILLTTLLLGRSLYAQEEYIVNIYDDRVGIHKYFQGVYLLSNLLENLGIRYYFFSALPQWWTAGHLKLNHD